MTTADPPQPDKRSSPPVHAAAFAAVWAFGFLVLRACAVSGYHWDTAFAVSTTLGLDDGLALLFGSLMAGHLLTAPAAARLVPSLPPVDRPR